MKFLNKIKSTLVQPFVAVALITSLLLSGCNGHSDDDLTNIVVGESVQANLSVVDATGSPSNSFTVGNQISVKVVIQTTTGAPLSNQTVEFSTTDGSLSASSRLTDDDGITTVTLDSTSVAAGVVTVTATTTYSDETITADIEFEVLSATLTNVESPALFVTLKNDGDTVNRIKAGDSGQLGVVLVDAENTPVADAIVSFTAEIGTLNASTALTNENGIAEVSLTGVEGDLGAALATASVSINDTTYTQTVPYEIVAADALDESTTVLIGHYNANNEFVDGTIGVDSQQISAGSTLGLSIALVDQNLNPIVSPTTVSFTSSCVSTADATLDSTTTTINGEAQVTYEDISCAGANGNSDTIVATVIVNSADLTASTDIELLPEALGSVSFISASPESIVLKGTGGQGKVETSTVTFQLKGQLGNPLSQQPVSFSLNTEVGGLSLASTQGVTNSDGLVSAKVIAGSVPAVVRVKASVESDGITVSSQSDLLSVNTGLPDQNSITLALDTLNPEARNNVGATVNVSAFLADSFNNPVPDGTTVNFTTEGGAIEPSCSTIEGNCSVIWTSQEPYPDNHRVTILATAEGHEYFVDVNGNNVFDDADGGSVNSTVANIDEILSGFGRISAFNGGFIDMPEAWRDDNENDLYDSGETFIDSDNSGNRTDVNDAFNGPQCQGSSCATDSFITIRKAALLITSSSSALYRLIDNSTGDVITSNYDNNATNATISIPRSSQRSLTLEMSDTQFQILPSETSIAISTDVGDSVGTGTFETPNSTGSSDPATPGTVSYTFVIVNNLEDDDTSETGGITFSATTPSGVETIGLTVVTLL